MFDLAIAVACILNPADCPPCGLHSLQTVAIAWELVDSRERTYFFAARSCVADDLRIVHERYTTLIDAPPVCDSVRWPDTHTLRAAMDLNREYVRWLERYGLLHKDEWIEDAISDAERLYRIYDIVCDSQREYYYVHVKRRSMIELMDLIGPVDYYAGTLPAPVPVWYFWRIE